MKKKTLAIAAAFVAAAFVAAGLLPASAHHSFAMFDNAKTQTIDGTVKEFEWVNPHSWIHIVVVNDQGKPEEWAFEMGSPGQLTTQGWKKDMVKVGDKVSVAFHPMKDGSHGGSQTGVKLPSGVTMGGFGANGAIRGRAAGVPPPPAAN